MKRSEVFPGESRDVTRKPLKAAFQQSGNGRRSDRRYSVDLPLQCKLVGSNQTVNGRVLDISCAGLYFVSSECLPKTAKVELSIDWPVLLNGVCRMQLRGYGRIVRSDSNGNAVAVSRFQFYTAGIRSASAFTLPSLSSWMNPREESPDL